MLLAVAPADGAAASAQPAVPAPVIHIGTACLSADGTHVQPYDLSFTWDGVAGTTFALLYSMAPVKEDGSVGTAVNGGFADGLTDHFVLWPNSELAPEAVTYKMYPGTWEVGATIQYFVMTDDRVSSNGAGGGGYTVVNGPTVTKRFTFATCNALRTAVPTITGTAAVGSTLTAKPGTWTTGTTFAYQWKADGAAIDGATGPTYTIAPTLKGKKVTVMVTGSKSGYSSVSKTSAATAVVGASFTPPKKSPFTDVSTGSAFYTEVTWLASSGVTTGYADGTFRPGNPITREAMAAFLYRSVGQPSFTVPKKSPFTDVSTKAAFYKEVTWLAQSGVTTGYADGTFRPGNPITREAMAAFLYRFGGSPSFTAPKKSPFKDVSTKATFYKEVTWLAQSGVTTGYADGTFRPGNQVTREATAAFLYRTTH